MASDESGRIKRATISIRTSEANKELLAQTAETAGRSLNQEIEFRLEVSLLRDREAGSRSVAALADFMRLAGTAIEQRTGKAWNEDAESFFAVRAAFEGFLYRNIPPTPKAVKEREQAEAEHDRAKARLDVARAATSFDGRSLVALLSASDPQALPDFLEKQQRYIEALDGELALHQRGEDTAEAASRDLLDLFKLRA